MRGEERKMKQAGQRGLDFGYLVCVLSRQVDSGCAGLRAVNVLSVCRLRIGQTQMAKERTDCVSGGNESQPKKLRETNGFEQKEKGPNRFKESRAICLKNS
jgi:hypothetical protein